VHFAIEGVNQADDDDEYTEVKAKDADGKRTRCWWYGDGCMAFF
jgi:hypothetical protein